MRRPAAALRMCAALAIFAVWCSSPAAASVRLLRSNIDWTTVVATGNVRFHMRFDNPDPSPSSPVTGVLNPQMYGAFMPNAGPPRGFDVPGMAPNSFFDVFTDIPLASLPPSASTSGGPSAGSPCPPPNFWNGNVGITWSGAGGQGQAVRHMGQVLVCPGGGCTFIHITEDCAANAPWTISGLCPGFSATLYEEDKVTPAANPAPPGWHGWLCVSAAATTPVPTTCCFVLTFNCAGQLGIVELCATTCNCNPTGANPQPGTIDWANVPGTNNVRFHVRWIDPSASDPTSPGSGDMTSQGFGVFQPDFGPIGHFNLPAIQVGGFFDVFFDVSRDQLPASAPITGGPPPNGPCPPDTSWRGNVGITWAAGSASGHVDYHQGAIHVCPGSGNTYIHILPLVCPGGTSMPWSMSALCSGFSATLVNEDYSPAPNPVPSGWSGYVCVSAAAATPIPVTCCFTVTFQCNNVPGLIYLCATTCDCHTPPNPMPGLIDWTTLTGTGTVRFHVRWDNPSSSQMTAPIRGNMNSQEFGVFLPDVGPIGQFSVPALAPSSSFDVFTDISLNQLPPNPPTPGAPDSTGPCPPDRHWNGNVDITWNGPAGPGQVTKHIGTIVVCPGAGASLIHIRSLTCGSAAGMPWSITGLCPGFSATLVNEDFSPAPNPVPPGWTGYVSISAAAATPIPITCCFKVTFVCDGVPGVIDLCATTCNCNPSNPNPVPGTIDWITQPNNMVRFHIRWLNPNSAQALSSMRVSATSLATSPISGDMMSQRFGVFLPDAGQIGHFDVPPIQPGSFFDVFFDVPLGQLPPSANKRLVGGGPPNGGPCPRDDHWDGNVDIVWSGPAGGGTVNKHVGTVLLNTGGGSSFIHVISGCTDAAGSTWSFGPVCPGFIAKLENEDHSPAPAVLPPGWTGWLDLSAPGTPPGSTCCVDLVINCGGASATIEVCAVTCFWGTLAVEPQSQGPEFAIRSVVPNPTGGPATMTFALPRPGRAKLEIFDAAGHRVRSVVDGQFGGGTHSVTWDGRDARGNIAQPGTYFVRLSAGNRTASHKFVMRQ